MDWLNWSNDEAETSPGQNRLEQIGDWIDEQFGYFSYFDTRSLVKSAMDNTLHADYPNTPYSAAEIIEWAEWNDKESFLMTPGGQAIDGEETSDTLFGAPKINPRTGEVNTQTAQNGVIVEFAKSSAMNLLKVGVALGAVALFYKWSSVKVERAAGKKHG